MGGYISEEVTGLSRQGIYDEIHSGSFKIGDASPTTLGRCFIEVDVQLELAHVICATIRTSYRIIDLINHLTMLTGGKWF